MLDFPLIDTHLHVWDPRLLRYSWLDDIPLLNKPYLLEDYDRACGPVAVEKMVFLQAEVNFDLFMQEADWVDSPRRSGRTASRHRAPGRRWKRETLLFRHWKSWQPTRESRASAESFSLSRILSFACNRIFRGD